jgi:hypothetical protein
VKSVQIIMGVFSSRHSKAGKMTLFPVLRMVSTDGTFLVGKEFVRYLEHAMSKVCLSPSWMIYSVEYYHSGLCKLFQSLRILFDKKSKLSLELNCFINFKKLN